MRDMNPQEKPTKLGPPINRQPPAPPPAQERAYESFRRDEHLRDGTVLPKTPNALAGQAQVTLTHAVSRVPEAMQILSDAMREDPDYARTWFDNICMAIGDNQKNGSPDFLVEVCMLIYSQRTD